MCTPLLAGYPSDRRRTSACNWNMSDLVCGFQCFFLSNWVLLSSITAAVPVFKTSKVIQKACHSIICCVAILGSFIVLMKPLRKHIPVSIQTELVIALDVNTLNINIIWKENVGTYLLPYYTCYVQLKCSHFLGATKDRPRLFCQHFMVLS